MNEVSIRMLAAIMFTDMVGYTALMQQDEAKAKEKRDRHRKVLDEFVTAHQGRILQFYGDGTLSIFGSAIEAVNCAVEIQKELRKDPCIPIRIGIHSGDIVYEDEGVYGDGVNIASRIENLSVPGGVLLSEKVYDEIQNHPYLEAVYVGKHNLKNVQKPVNIYAVCTDGLTTPTVQDIAAKSNGSGKSIAVLPFVNMSGDPENEYFSDGITEEILNALSKVDGLLVTSRTSSFVFKGKNEDIRQIGEKLNVSHVLEGSVRRAGNRVRITAQLINASDGYHIWSESFDGDLEDIFAVQDEISRKIANKLREKLSLQEIKEPLVKNYTENIEAYNLYLKSLYYWNRWDAKNIEKALKCLEKAIELDENFVLPYAGLSNCYVYLGAMGCKPNTIAYPLAKELAVTAVELDPNLMDGHLALGLVATFFDWDWKEAEIAFNKALQLNSNSARLYHGYSVFLGINGRYDEAIAAIDKAYQLDPLSIVIINARGESYAVAGYYDQAARYFRQALDLDPNFRAAMNNLGWVYLEKGELFTAIRIFEEVQKLTGSPLKGITQLGYAYAKAGLTEKALDCLEKLKQRKIQEPETSLSLDFAVLYSALGEVDEVFYHLNKAYEERLGGIVMLRHRSTWKEVRKDSRFAELMKKVGLIKNNYVLENT
jgi:TolB-like protein/class 3 adenylate cyclase/Tfp pilus assembly protein PilF